MMDFVSKFSGPLDDSFLDQPELLSQFTTQTDSGQPVTEAVYEIDAVNPLAAKTRVRRFVRTNDPTITDVLKVSVSGSEPTEQPTLGKFFPESFEQERFKVSVVYRQ